MYNFIRLFYLRLRKIPVDEVKKIDKLIERALSVRESSPEIALETLKRALNTAKSINDEKAEATILRHIGSVYVTLSDYKKSIEYLELSFDLFNEIGDKNSQVNVLSLLGTCRGFLGDFTKSLEFLFRSLKLSKELNDDENTAKILNNLGNCYYSMDDLDSAKKYFLEALSLKEKANDLRSLSSGYTNLALIYSQQKDLELAEKYIQKSIRIKENFTDNYKDETSLAFTKNILGLIKKQSKEYTEALKHFDEVLNIYQKQSNPLMLAETYALIAATYLETKDYINALQALNAGERFAKQTNATRITEEFQKLYSEVSELKAGKIKSAANEGR